MSTSELLSKVDVSSLLPPSHGLTVRIWISDGHGNISFHSHPAVARRATKLVQTIALKQLEGMDPTYVDCNRVIVTCPRVIVSTKEYVYVLYVDEYNEVNQSNLVKRASDEADYSYHYSLDDLLTYSSPVDQKYIRKVDISVR